MPSIPEYLITPPAFAKIALGLRLYNWQERVLWDLNLPGAVALRAANNSGKTSVVGASAALWNAAAFPGSLSIATASVFRQIESQLFPALHRHAGKFPGGVFNSTDVTLANGSRIIGFSADDSGRAEGWHDPHLLAIIDEAKSVPDTIFQSIERCAPVRLLVMSSPGPPSGYFYQCFTERRQYYKTHVVPANLCPHIPQKWIDEQISKFGRDHPLIQSMVFAEWMTLGESGEIIPLKFIERCLAEPPDFKDDGSVQAGCDFAAGGDSNCLAIRRGNAVSIAACWKEQDTAKAIGKFVTLFRENDLKPDQILADEGGMGCVFCDLLAEAGWPVRRFNFGSPARDADHFTNAGAELWFAARRRIEKKEIILPRDDELIAQLSTRRGWPNSKGKLELESKADLRGRGIGSPDKADGVLLTLARHSSGDGWGEKELREAIAANPQLSNPSAPAEFDRERERERGPFRLQQPGVQFPSSPNLSRTAVGNRTFFPRRLK